MGDNQRNQWVWDAPVFADSNPKVEYFPLPADRASQAKSIGYMLHTAGGDADEVVSIDYDYTVDGTNFIQIGSVQASIDVGSTPTIAAKAAAQLLSEINTRIPAGAVLRCTLTPAGTTPTFRLYPYIHFNNL